MDTYTIKEISNRFQLPASTLRYYEEIGLLNNVTHTAKHQRVYTQEHIDRLNAISCFKQTGLSLGKMQEFFTYEKDLKHHLPEIFTLLSQQEQDIQKQILQLQEGLAHIQHKIRFYHGIEEAIEKNLPWPCWDCFAQPNQ